MRLTDGIRDFIADESAATAIEYSLLVALVALMIIVGAKAMGTNLNSFFNKLADCLSDAAGCVSW
jgi:pilus assembly protein Flp/PilA